MNFSRPVLSAMLLLLGSQLVSTAQAESPTKQLLDLSNDIQERLTPQSGSSDQVSAAVSKDAALPGLVVTIQPGKADYPGIGLIAFNSSFRSSVNIWACSFPRVRAT